MSTLFPMFVKLAGRRCLVVGAGTIAESKIQSLLTAGASVRVIAPSATELVAEWAQEQKIQWEKRPFQAQDLDSTFLVITATSSQSTNESVFREAARRGVLCNAVDDPSHCDFYYPAVVHRGDLQIAISTAGTSPALAQRLRRELERQFGPEYESWLRWLGKQREALFTAAMDTEPRRRLLHKIARNDSFNRFAHSRGAAHNREGQP